MKAVFASNKPGDSTRSPSRHGSPLRSKSRRSGSPSQSPPKALSKQTSPLKRTSMPDTSSPELKLLDEDFENKQQGVSLSALNEELQNQIYDLNQGNETSLDEEDVQRIFEEWLVHSKNSL